MGVKSRMNSLEFKKGLVVEWFNHGVCHGKLKTLIKNPNGNDCCIIELDGYKQYVTIDITSLRLSN